MAATASASMECLDFLEFQSTLQQMRQIDDKIIYMLNSTVPTESFRSQIDPTATCKDLFHQIQSGHAKREIAIKNCINSSKDKVKYLKSRKEAGEDTPEVIKNLRKEQTNLRLLEAELGVEEVVKKRTLQVYYEKCRSYFKPKERISA
ncbi:protein MIX23 [Prorops nasuta]|uniref:protein MIX23 n=1 Tax=Prorops nasuta TaxID=863751 RepID=UPI0034CFEF8F